MLFNLFKRNVIGIFIYEYILHILFPLCYLINKSVVYFLLLFFVHEEDLFPLPVKTVINLPLDCLLIFPFAVIF